MGAHERWDFHHLRWAEGLTPQGGSQIWRFSATVVNTTVQSKLVAIAGPWKGSSFPLAEGTHIVGREFESAIQLDEVAVSRRHCSITRAGDRCTVSDLGSHNGTFV